MTLTMNYDLFIRVLRVACTFFSRRRKPWARPWVPSSALSHPFFWVLGSPAKIDYRKKVGTLILTSPLETGGPLASVRKGSARLRTSEQKASEAEAKASAIHRSAPGRGGLGGWGQRRSKRKWLWLSKLMGSHFGVAPILEPILGGIGMFTEGTGFGPMAKWRRMGLPLGERVVFLFPLLVFKGISHY